jgi:putative ABC transport system permease protein
MKSLAEQVLRVVVPPEDRRHILDELDELYEAKAAKLGAEEALRWRRRQIWRFVARALPVFWWKRPLTGAMGLMSNRDGRLSSMDLVRQDLRFAFRSFVKKPGLAVSAVLILGVGIGAATTMFSVVDTVMLRPLPYPDPGELVHFGGHGGTRPMLYLRWRDGLESFDGIGAASTGPANLTGEGPPQRVRSAGVTDELLPLLGARPHLGRLFTQDDFQGEASVVLLGPGFWERNWGGDPSVVGRTLIVNGSPVVVAGILSPDFHPPEAVTGNQVDVWLPFRAETEESLGWSILAVVGRLKDGVGAAGAQAELRSFTTNLAEEYPDLLIRQDGTIRHTNLIPLQVATFRGVGSTLLFLTWAVLLMLLIACANVANLLLAHGTGRARELALRGALGASRNRIVKQLLTESISLGLAGGVLGVGLAFLGVRLFLRFSPGGVPRIEDLAVDPRVLGFAFLASLVTGLVFGTVPALHASRRDVAKALQEGSTASSASRRGKRTRSGLVVLEIALALVLLSSAGLFLRSLVLSTQVDLGFRTEQLVSASLRLVSGYEAEQRQDFTRAVKERLEALPGTRSVAASLTVPFEFTGASRCCMSNDVSGGVGSLSVDPLPRVMIHPVTPGYFRTLGAQLSAGREFEAADEEGDGFVAVISEPAARYFFGADEAVGKSIHLANWGAFTIIGVARGVRHWGVPSGVEAEVYVPWGRWGAFSDIYQLTVRSAAPLESLAPAVREAIWAIDPNLPVEEVVPMDQRVEASRRGQRFITSLLGTFAMIALVLATGGIYASMLYAVGQRRREMGIRLALGAGGGQLVRMVIRAGLTLTVIGVGLGLAGSMGVSVVLRSWLYGVGIVDTVTIGSVVLVLACAALLASMIPALKAARTDPLDTLKVE